MVFGSDRLPRNRFPVPDAYIAEDRDGGGDTLVITGLEGIKPYDDPERRQMSVELAARAIGGVAEVIVREAGATTAIATPLYPAQNKKQ